MNHIDSKLAVYVREVLNKIKKNRNARYMQFYTLDISAGFLFASLSRVSCLWRDNKQTVGIIEWRLTNANNLYFISIGSCFNNITGIPRSIPLRLFSRIQIRKAEGERESCRWLKFTVTDSINETILRRQGRESTREWGRRCMTLLYTRSAISRSLLQWVNLPLSPSRGSELCESP